jgi:hypothetical protein
MKTTLVMPSTALSCLSFINDYFNVKVKLKVKIFLHAALRFMLELAYGCTHF